MKVLILLSHGSRRRESNEEMMRLARTVASLEGCSFDKVVCAFQQFVQPDFPQTLTDLVAQGASHITVFPLFLASGSHVREDVPALMAEARETYPDLTITVMPHLGQIDGMADFLLGQAEAYRQ